MKISKNQLLQIIKEELQSVLKEVDAHGDIPDMTRFAKEVPEYIQTTHEQLRTAAEVLEALKQLQGTLRHPEAKQFAKQVIQLLGGDPGEDPDLYVGGAAKKTYENQKRNKRNK